VTHSEVAHAVSDSPLGPWRHHDVALPPRGTNFWDGSCTHNPTVLRIAGKYYLYYMGNYGDGIVKQPLNWEHRNHQRIGVAVADSPNGPWQRFDQPVLDISADTNAPDALMTSNPSVVQRPDGRVLMIYKAVGLKRPLPFGGPVVHLAATADHPLGPFTKHPGEIFGAQGVMFAAEDPFIWRGADRYWAVVKDNEGHFTHRGYSLALWESKDGMDWTLSQHPFVANPGSIRWADGRAETLTSIERPQLLFENGEPIALCCAAADNQERDGSFNIQIPLKVVAPLRNPPGSAASRFSTSGAWSFSSLPGHETNKNSIYTREPGATATWRPELRSDGPTRLSLFLVTHPGNDRAARVEVFAEGKTNILSVDMESGMPRWLPLGEFGFSGRGDEFVRVRSSGKGTVRISALKTEILDSQGGQVWQTLIFDDLLPQDPARLRRVAPGNIRPGPPNPEQWELTFSDDFNGSHLDTNVWRSAQGQSWGKLLSARYPENIAVSNGLLRLITKKEKRGGKEWTSAMLSTTRFRQTYGYWESRYRYAAASGLNQAFWMNAGAKDKTQGFEIDVNEGHYPADINSSLHQSELPSQSKRFVADYDLAADFHLYAVEWNENEVIYYFDGQEIFRVPNTKAHLDVPVIFATAVLPFWAGPVTDDLDGKSMDVDWVRVYRKRPQAPTSAGQPKP
jgi:beta-glucanase (GH16 family)